MEESLLDDYSLLVRARNANANAFALLYDRYSALVYSIALRVLGDRSNAEEVTQEVFARVWQKADSYDPKLASLATWISRIARNCAIDEVRRQKGKRDLSLPDWDSDFESVNPVYSVAAGDDPAQKLIAESTANEVRKAIATLPPEQYQALMLAFFKGLTHKEIAKVLSQPLGTIKTRIRLAMKKLQTMLSGHAE